MNKYIIEFLVLLLSVQLMDGCGVKGDAFGTDWNDIITSYQDTSRTVVFLDLARLNLALAETGQLADKAFTYIQGGPDGLIPEWGQKPEAGALLSDIYYSMGYIALSQRYAFETLVQDEPEYTERMLARLVETNLIYGAYPVAEKYIIRLEEGGELRQWAAEHRRFLNDDAAVEADPVLGAKRRCIPKDDFLSDIGTSDERLKNIIRTNPENRAAVDYLGVMYLLDCNFESFKSMIDEFYGTSALESLPVSFAEAACMMSEIYHDWWKSVGVDIGIYRRYTDFKKRLESGRSQERYKRTYWYYVMMVNSL